MGHARHGTARRSPVRILLPVAVVAVIAVLVAAGCGLGGNKSRPADPVQTLTSSLLAIDAASVTPTGAGPILDADQLQTGGPAAARFITYLQFELPSPVGSILSASLQLTVGTSSKGGFLVVGTKAAKRGQVLTAANAPALTFPLGRSGATVRGDAVTVKLRGLTAGTDGETTLALVSVSGGTVQFSSPSTVAPPRLNLTRRIGGPTPTRVAPTPSNAPVRIAAAGDIACDADEEPPSGKYVIKGFACGQKATSNLLLKLHPDAVLALGDTQYSDATPAKYAASYAPSWGRLIGVTHPVAGNHEYLASPESANAAGYFSYFGAAAGALGQGWYSFDLGGWHLIALNGECKQIGGCHDGSPQERWLKADLAAHPNQCTLAYWHEPRFSSGQHGNEPVYDEFWEDLYRAGADVVLNAHDHNYERFAPQNPNGQADSRHGIREFIVGTGGEDLRPYTTVKRNSEVRENHTFGVLEMTLGAGTYSWRFQGVPGSSFTDGGTGTCHAAPIS